MLIYPAILYPPDPDGLSGCLVPDFAICASGRSPDDAVQDAAAILTELLHDLAMDAEPFPDPTPVEDVDVDGGTLVLLTATAPRAAA